MGGEFEFELPEPIIQRLQSLFTGKEAAQTTILSKSWRSAWLTRPNLHFNETEINIPTDEFLEFANKTVERYEESNLNIESFGLFTESRMRGDSDRNAKELILKALKIGANDLTFQIRCYDWEFVLPHEVFGSENLVGLSVKGCKIDLGVIRCSRLESLCLDSVGIDDHSISNIISSCPLIQNLSLVGSESPINLPKLHNLRCLVLSAVGINNFFYGDLSTKFPSLKELTLRYCCNAQDEIRICSRSLEHLNFEQGYYKVSRVEFDVPSIRKFMFEGWVIPSLSFISTSSEWESHLSIKFDFLSTSWFLELNKFLTELSRSKIYLTLHSFDYNVEDIQALFTKKHEVENLTLDFAGLPSSTASAIFCFLLRLCRPKLITELSSCRKAHNDFLCKKLAQGVNGEFSNPSNSMHGLHDLEDVSAQLYDEVVAAWCDVPLESFLDASTSPKDKQTIRFQLKWKP
ncbi:F-box/LRR-repeat protein at2g42730 [Phtheirospermum japonicum]|uniref:F-box/LRR-repeat protein at2g42730 n=1 Tax=Phtheirospermum japonicum TaxID=374723 RepID=A0A830BPC8_9LAMI|nr:F-box/LRR-repeat protein at2g42730 [Phtheirospermum japonicum]